MDHPFYEAWLNGGDLTPPLHVRKDIADLSPLGYHLIYIVYGMLRDTYNEKKQELTQATYNLGGMTYEKTCYLLSHFCAKYFANLCSQKEDDKPVYLPVHTPLSFRFFDPVCHIAIIKTCESRHNMRNPLGFYFCMLDYHDLDPDIKTLLYKEHDDFQSSKIRRNVPNEVRDIIHRADTFAKAYQTKIHRNAVDKANLPPVQKPTHPQSRKNSQDDTVVRPYFSEVTATNLRRLDRETLIKLF